MRGGPQGRPRHRAPGPGPPAPRRDHRADHGPPRTAARHRERRPRLLPAACLSGPDLSPHPPDSTLPIVEQSLRGRAQPPLPPSNVLGVVGAAVLPGLRRAPDG